MQTAQALALLGAVLAGTPTAWAAQARTNPLSKVLDLLGGLSAKITKEGEAELKAYNKFVNWCDDTSKNGKYEVKMTKAQKAKLEAKIGEFSSAIQVADTKVEELAASIATGTTDLKSATVIRKKEAADFATSESELTDVIDTLGRAIMLLEREMQKNPASFAQMNRVGTKGLLQTLSAVIDAAGFSSSDRQKLVSMVQARQSTDADDEQLGAPAAAAYESHGGGILDVLEDLKEKAEAQLSDLRKAETNTRMNYEMLKTSLESQAAADTKDMEDEKAAKAGAREGKATAEGDLEKTTKELKNAEEALETASTDCMQTAADHDATVKARNEELKVLGEAIKFLKEKASGAGDKAYSLLQVDGASASGSRIHSRADLAGSEVIALVKRLAREHHSSALAQLASRLSAVIRFGAASGQDPFAKVRELIQGLIENLEKEATAESTEKAYCDSEMAKTEAKKTDLDEDLAKLTTKIDQSASKSAELKEDVKSLQDELSLLAKTQAEMDKMRQETHAEYSQAKADLENGLEGVRAAIGMLRDYYASDSGAAAAMLQANSHLSDEMRQPEQHSKSTGAGAGIVALLEVVESDFASTLAKEETQEEDAQAEYEKISQENSITRTQKEMDVKYKTKEIASLQKTLSELSSDRENSNTEYSAVLEYYSKLKQRCIAKPDTYEERKKRRAEEIAGLKDALSILEDETAFMQRKHRGFFKRGSLVSH